MGVRFVHAADLHLGSPLETRGAESERLQQHLRDATYTAVERIIDLAIREAVDFVLLAGDLYDQKNRSVRANEFLVSQFDRLNRADIPVYVIYGNHDPLSDATTFIELPPNVHEFGADSAEEVLHPDASAPTARIWGQSYRTESERRSMHTGFAPADDRIPNIGLLHTGLDPDGSNYVPCSVADLVDAERFHYWALGHIHHPRLYRDSPPIVHPGVPQGRHAGETGPGGCLLVDLETDEVDLQFVPTSPVVWHTIDVDIEAADEAEYTLTTVDGIQRYIEDTANDVVPDYDALEGSLGIPVRRPEWQPDGHVVRWRLTGRGDCHEFLTSTDEPILDRVASRLQDRLSNRAIFIHTDSVEDRTGPPLPDIETLRGSDQVVDEFYRLLDDLDGDEAARDAMRATLHYDNSRNIWQRVEDPEAVDDDRLALTEERLDDLIERAQDRVLNELVRRRVD
jgi:DNA repair exonuclease SbcCD nuclease subunit